MALHIATPLLRSNAFDTGSGQQVWLKMEALQPSGSFKLRGIGHACETYAARARCRSMPSTWRARLLTM
jgi:L-serine/L-threonine ammonia-lyase